MTALERVSINEQKIDALFAAANQTELPGCAIGIALEGEPVYRKGFGRASLELPVTLTPEMRLRIGSATKSMTALACLQLAQEGKLRIDDPIARYVPEIHPLSGAATLRQLMGHTSGLRDSHDLCWQFSGTGHRVTAAELLAFYSDLDDVNDVPQANWSYNNGGYLLLSIAMERVTGQSLEALFQERLFGPLGMIGTLLRRWDTDFVDNSASLHMSGKTGGYERAYLGSELTGEGGVCSTVDDMLRWLTQLSAPAVGTESTWKTLTTPQTLANGESTNYGCGLIDSRYRGFRILSHPGGVMGGNAQMLRVPAAALDVVVLVNRHDLLGMQLANQILDTCLPGLEPLSSPGAGALRTGVFLSPRTHRVIELSVREGRQVVAIDGDEMPFVCTDTGTLEPAPLWSFLRQRLSFEGTSEEPEAVLLSEFGNRDGMVRAPRCTSPKTPDLLGRYISEASGTQIDIERGDEGLEITSTGRFGRARFKLVCLAEGICRARSIGVMPWGGVLVFKADRSGFRWSTSRTRALPFIRVS
jgi:D-aminopeptidase